MLADYAWLPQSRRNGRALTRPYASHIVRHAITEQGTGTPVFDELFADARQELPTILHKVEYSWGMKYGELLQGIASHHIENNPATIDTVEAFLGALTITHG